MVRFVATKFYGSMVVFTGMVLTLMVNSIRSNQTTKTLDLSIKITPIVSHPPTLDYIVITETPIPTPTRLPTKTPTKTPIPIHIDSSNIEYLMEKYANKESINREFLKKIANCESRFNPSARNGDYGGMYQFSPSSWTSARKSMNLDTNPDLRFNAEEAIKTAAFKIARGHDGIWPNCSK